MTKEVYNLDLRIDLEALAASLDDSFTHLGFLCGNDLGRSPTIDLPPGKSYLPEIQALHGTCYERFTSRLPLPPFFEGDTAVLVRLTSITHGFRIAQETQLYVEWLDARLPEWRAIERDIAQCDPRERREHCWGMISPLVSAAGDFVGLHYDQESWETPRDAACDSIVRMVMASLISPRIETRWSSAYAAYRGDNYDAMALELYKKPSSRDALLLFSGLIKTAYRLSQNTPANHADIAKWGDLFLKNFERLLPHLEAGADGRKVCPALQYLVMYHERNQAQEKAISLCQLALTHQLHDETKGGFERRLA